MGRNNTYLISLLDLQDKGTDVYLHISLHEESKLHLNYPEESDSYFDDSEVPPRPLHERALWRTKWVVPILIHSIIMVILVAVGVFIGEMRAAATRTPLLIQSYSPAENALQPELQVFDSKGPPDSPYAGKPRESLDRAWTELLQYTNVRFTAKELDLIDPQRKAQAIALPDGGYFRTLHVIHELHCIKHLHHFLYSEHYFPNLSSIEMEDRRIHMEHCLDTLRQGVMCRGDVAPITMRWGRQQAIPLANFSSSHNCVNWELIQQWSQERVIQNLFDPGYLRHPIYGVVYKENFDNQIGIVHDE